MTQLPLFPLRTVLFPGMLLPIHVFEPRYLQMIRACQADDEPFGVVLSRPQGRTGLTHAYALGTSAHIINAEDGEDGTLDIVVVGRDRFKITKMVRTQPYLVGETHGYPLKDVYAPSVAELSQRLRNELQPYMDLLSKATGTVIRVEELPDEPEILCWVVGIALQISLEEQERLLGCEDLPTLLRQELELLSLEKQLLRFIAETQEEKDDWTLAPYIHWSPN